MLGAGQTLRLAHGGLTIVTALSPSALVLSDDPSSAAAGTPPALTLRQRLTRGLTALAPRAARITGDKSDAYWNAARFVRAV